MRVVCCTPACSRSRDPGRKGRQLCLLNSVLLWLGLSFISDLKVVLISAPTAIQRPSETTCTFAGTCCIDEFVAQESGMRGGGGAPGCCSSQLLGQQSPLGRAPVPCIMHVVARSCGCAVVQLQNVVF